EPIGNAAVKIMVKDKDPVDMKSTSVGKFATRVPEMLAYSVEASADGFIKKEQKFMLPELVSDTTIFIEILLRPVAKKLLLSGNVYDKKTDQQIPAKLDISLKDDRTTHFQVLADKGSYEKEISKKGWYIITASSEGYLNATDSVSAESEDQSPFIRDLFLLPIEVGLTVRLKNIYFD